MKGLVVALLLGVGHGFLGKSPLPRTIPRIRGGAKDLQASTTASSEVAANSFTTSEEIIPREVLFGNPEYASPNISPDGKLLAFLKPSADGVLNIFCRTVDGDDDRQVTGMARSPV